MEILWQRVDVGGETPRRGRARIAGNAIAARLVRFADCPASAGVRGRMARNLFAPDLAAIDIGEVDDRRTINWKQAPRLIAA
jgi:hypothetical protein